LRHLCRVIEPVYPKAGRPPVGVERMLRIYFLQHWFNLSDTATETFQGSWKTLIPAAKSWS